MKKSNESVSTHKKAHAASIINFYFLSFLLYTHTTHKSARENEKKETLNSNTTVIIVEKLFFSSVVVIEQSNNG
tara:strand:+ start:1016 stop:1237 length:222 start_codon:yes stop_codon:yes gene_type:complete